MTGYMGDCATDGVDVAAAAAAIMDSAEVMDGDGKQVDDGTAYVQEAHSVVVEAGW